MFPHYCKTWNEIKQNILKPVIKVFYYLTAKMSLRVTENVHLQAVFKISAFCTDTRCQWTSPLINSNVNNVLLEIFSEALQEMSEL